MGGVRRPVTALLGVLAAVVLSAVPAAASVDEVLAGLREDPLFVSQDSSVTPDRAAVREALEDTRVPTYVVVVPQSEVDAQELGIDGLTLRIVEGLADPEAVVVVVSDGQELQAADGGRAGVDASAVLDQVLADRLDEPFGSATLTRALVDFAGLVDEGETASPVPGEAAGSTRRTVGLVGLVATAALGGGGWLYLRAQRRVLASAPLTRDDLTPQSPGWQGVADR